MQLILTPDRTPARGRRLGGAGRFAAGGFSIVELMVALAIGGFIMLLLAAVFFTSSVTRKESERAARQIENGRYAMQILSEDIKHAGYLGEFNPSVLATPGTTPNPCLTTVADLNAALPVHIQGYDGGSGLTTECTTLLADRRTGTDVVVVRRTSTCVVGAAGCDATLSGAPYFQASLCGSGTELASTTATDYFVLDVSTGTFGKHKKDCAATAGLRRYLTHIYFITNNDVSGDGIPTLKRADFAIVGGALAFKIVPVAEGIDNLQVEYGIDTDGDGAPNAFTADPDSYNGCAGAACVTNLRNVVSVRVNLLARNTDATAGWSDDRVYTLGLKADGSANNFPSSGSGYADAYKRHAYTSQIRLVNPASRRLVP